MLENINEGWHSGVVDIFDLKGKNAVVIGASRGIGKGLCLSLAKAGANVVAVGRSAGKLEETATEARRCGVKAVPVAADVTAKEEVAKVKREALAAFGHIDILINCQGVIVKKWALEMLEEDWEEVIGVNLNSVFMTCKAFGAHMVERKKGKIVNIASITSYAGIRRSSAYAASKGGLLQLTKVLAIEWAPYNVNVNCIAPGFLRTELTVPLFSDKEAYDRIISRTPMKRTGEVDDLTGALIYLVSSASDYVTGVSLPVDGGFLACGI